MKTIKESKISKKLFLIMLFVSLSAVSCLSLFQIYSSYYEGKKVAENYQKQALDSILNEIEEHFLLIKKMMELSSHSKGVLENGINERFRFYLWKILKHNPSVFEVVAIDNKGKEMLVASRIRPELAGEFKDVSNEDYFQKAVSGKVFFSKIKYHFDGTKPYIVVAIPVYKFDGSITAVLASKVWFLDTQNLLSKKMFGETGYAYIVDVDKNILAHPKYELILKNVKISEISKELENAMDNAIKNPGVITQVRYRNADGKKVFCSLKFVKDFNWIIAVAQQEFEIYSATIRTIASFLLISGILIFIVLLVVKRLSNKLSLPIIKLRNLTTKISEGDFSTRIEIKTNDEIEELASNFNEMTEKLKNSYEELESKVDERTKELLLLYSFTASISKNLHVSETIKNAGDELSVVLELDGFVGMLYKDGNWLLEDAVCSAIGVDELNILWKKLMDQNIIQHLSQHHVPSVLNISEDINFFDVKTLSSIKSVAVFPILYQGEILGIMILFSSTSNFFNSNILSAVETCMIQLGVAIANAERYEFTEELSYKDPLTKLFNRRYFETKLDHEFERCLRYERDASLCMIDIDFFKKINDTYGHQSGDAILKQLAKIIQDSIRKSDVAARFGGEEFIILMPETPLEKAFVAMERLRKKVEENAFAIGVEPFNISLTISIGISCFMPSMTKKEIFIEQADKALYKAKQSGRNRVCQ